MLLALKAFSKKLLVVVMQAPVVNIVVLISRIEQGSQFFSRHNGVKVGVGAGGGIDVLPLSPSTHTHSSRKIRNV